MPRELKGRSPQFQSSPERMTLDRALERMDSLFARWGLDAGDYVLVDEFAYLLQGYSVISEEVEKGHIDVYVNPRSLPWLDRGERSIVPPVEGGYMDQWIKYMKETGYQLDILRGHPTVMAVPTVRYELPNGEQIRLMRAFKMTQAFVEQTLLHYSLSDVGPEKIREWLKKLEIIKGAAGNKNDVRLADFCETMITKCKERWQEVL